MPPTVTVEDLVLAKLTALHNRSDRFKDLDDLQSIFSHQVEIDLDYLSARMRALVLVFPRPLWPGIPPALAKPSRAIAREARKRARGAIPDVN